MVRPDRCRCGVFLNLVFKTSTCHHMAGLWYTSHEVHACTWICTLSMLMLLHHYVHACRWNSHGCRLLLRSLPALLPRLLSPTGGWLLAICDCLVLSPHAQCCCDARPAVPYAVGHSASNHMAPTQYHAMARGLYLYTHPHRCALHAMRPCLLFNRVIVDDC